jgi:hypothetical protein
MADDKDYAVLQAMIEPLTQGVNAIATRPQKTFQSVTSTPYALADLEEARNQIGLSTKELNDVLKGREQLGYSLANTLANMPQQQGYGSWLTDFARGFGMGASAPANARMARAQQIYEAQMKDLANRLAFDKAMGEKQVSIMGYTPFATGKADGQGAEQPESYDFSKPEMPEKPIEWSDVDIQGQKTDPETGLPTLTGLIAKYTGKAIESEGRFSKNANQNAYTKSFTVPAITKVAKAAGGSRGIDTIPEVQIKGGPELSSSNMNATEFANAVKDQAWDIADQIIKANPKATITREELANAVINNFNHRIRKEYRVVNGFNIQQSQQQTRQVALPTNNGKYDYSKYGF